MRVFLSYSPRDKDQARLIGERLELDGHEIWIDALSIRAGDNIAKKIYEALGEAEVVLALISGHSLQSEGVRAELTALAFGEISGGQQRIILVLLDSSTVPSYLAQYQYLDMSQDFERGLERLAKLLSRGSEQTVAVRRKELEKKRQSYDSQVEALKSDLRYGRLTLVLGAGVSMGAGIPCWNDLLLLLLERMMKRIAKDHSLDLGSAKGAEFQKRYGASALIIGKYLKNNLGKDFTAELRDALYATNPKTCPLIDAIVSLSRPKRARSPLDSIITFNFDALIEENLDAEKIRNRPIYTEAIKHKPSELPVYHVHGYLPRKGRIPANADVVFSEDAYHSQFLDPFSWSNLVQLTKLSQNTCLFIGLSLTDPNVRRLLDVSRRKNPNKVLSHYILKKAPSFTEGPDAVDDLGRFLEEQDANALGLNVIWIEAFHEIQRILDRIAEDD